MKWAERREEMRWAE